MRISDWSSDVCSSDLPPILITGGLNDPRVTYWEPAKCAAKLRATKSGQNVLLLKTNMGAGHGGKSGRFESLEEDAEEIAFNLWQLGLVAGAWRSPLPCPSRLRTMTVMSWGTSTMPCG